MVKRKPSLNQWGLFCLISEGTSPLPAAGPALLCRRLVRGPEPMRQRWRRKKISEHLLPNRSEATHFSRSRDECFSPRDKEVAICLHRGDIRTATFSLRDTLSCANSSLPCKARDQA